MVTEGIDWEVRSNLADVARAQVNVNQAQQKRIDLLVGEVDRLARQVGRLWTAVAVAFGFVTAEAFLLAINWH